MRRAVGSRSTPFANTSLSLWRVALQGLLFYRSMLWPIALGVAAATAVIVGALLVGDSVRGSLHFLAIDRLGKIDDVLIAPRFFEESTLEKWANQPTFPVGKIGKPLPAIFFQQASIERSKTSQPNATGITRSGNTLVLGITEAFWKLGDSLPEIAIGHNEIVLNQALADELGVDLNDLVVVRLPAQTAIPADSPLGRRDSETVNLPGLKVIRIIPNQSLGRFDLRSNQRPSKNAFLSLQAIQDALKREGQVNGAIFPKGVDDNSNHSKDAQRSNANQPIHVALLDSLPLSLSDLGYEISHVQRVFPDPKLGEAKLETQQAASKVFDYFQITTDQMLLPDRVVARVRELWPVQSSSSVLTYLANGIQKISAEADSLSIPYSTIAAVEPGDLNSKSIGFADPTLENLDSLGDDEIIINAWLAKQLAATVGDSLRVDYFLPETIDGREVEQSFSAKIVAVVPLTEPELGYRRNRAAKFGSAPTVFNDPNLTPEVPGITDQDSMSDWDLPFVLTRKIRKEDDDYWTNHRLTPKLFVPLGHGQKLFGARFGSVSSIRLSSEIRDSIDEIQTKLTKAIRPFIDELGWQVIPLREQQLAAARGTTPFDILFLSLSFFVILSALILVSLLFRLGIERRAAHWGLLLAIGWPLKRVRQLLIVEGMSLALVGLGLGVGLGILYAYGVLSLLRTWWVGAVGSPFLTFFMTSKSLAIGMIAGLVVAFLTISMATRMLARQAIIRLLRGNFEEPILRGQSDRTWRAAFAIVLAIATLGITTLGFFLNGQAAGGAFVGAGMTALAAMLFETSRRLRNTAAFSKSQSPTVKGHERLLPMLESHSATTLMSLAMSSIRRNPTRSTLAIGLVSVATLLILSMSLFEAVPDTQGTGGFQLMAGSSVPIGKSLSDASYLRETLGEKAKLLMESTNIAMRVRDGDDAGCNNLYQASQPKVLGISSKIAEYDSTRGTQETFAWAGAASPISENEKRSRWRLLEREADGSIEQPFPVIIDQNTAMWALHLTGGIGQKFAYTLGAVEVHFETVGLLQNTILQGSLILGEKNFNRAFPNISGYRAWLVHLPQNKSLPEVSRLLENGWSDEGMDSIDSESVLRNLLAVQNTYLKAFQSLGALGLLLGTFGLAVVQMRSVMERQAEIGLLRAIGFTPGRIGRLVFLESSTLLLVGLGVGCGAASVALLPTVLRANIRPDLYSPFLMLGVIAFFGVFASLFAVRKAMQIKLLGAIRND